MLQDWYWTASYTKIIVIPIINIVIWIFHFKLNYFIHWYDHYIFIVLIYMKLYVS
jgi:hypothetical protein